MNDIDHVDLNLLKSLKALLTERHVGRAAERMNVTQPAMSHTLARLREVFDDPLFVRIPTGLEPTERALALTGQLNSILIEVGTLVAPETFVPLQTSGRFRIQTHDFIATTWLGSLFRTSSRAAPGLSLDIQTFKTNSYELMSSGELDLIIGAGLRTPSRFLQRKLVSDELVCLVDKKHPALDTWDAETVFRYPHSRLALVADRDDPVTAYGRKNGMPPRETGIIVESLHMQASFLKGTDLIAFVPAAFARSTQRYFGLRVMPCPLDLPTFDIRAIWHERTRNAPLHKWVRSLLTDAFATEGSHKK